jgi:glycosyltransferase involved in cell wall biosynthesis
MRILKVSNAYPPFLELGGPPRKVAAFAMGLAQRGHDVKVLTVAHDRRHGPLPKQTGGVTVEYVRPFLSYRSLALNPAMPSARCLVAGCDVVHIYGLYDLLGPSAAWQCRRQGVPYILEPMGMHPPIVRSLRKKRAYQRIFGRALVGGAGRVIATSAFERDQLAADGVPTEKLELRRNVVDTSEAREHVEAGSFRRLLSIAPTEPIVLYFGRITRKKRPDLLLEAVATMPVACQLVFAGPDEDDWGRALEVRAAALGITDRVRFTGPLYGSAKASALQEADVFALPSESENYGNAVVEAMAVGTPVVISDRCGVAPHVDGRAGIVVPVDAKAVAKALERLLTDEPLRLRMSAEGPVVSATLASVDDPVGQLEQIYRDVAAE